MLLPSDMIIGLPFTEVKPVRGVARFESIERSGKDQPLFTAEITTENKERVTVLKIQKHQQKGNGWMYSTKFEGMIDGPKNLHLLLRWIGVI